MKQHWQYVVLILGAQALSAMSFEADCELDYLKARFNHFGRTQIILQSNVQRVNTPFIPNESTFPSARLEPAIAKLSAAVALFKCNFSNCRSRFNDKNGLRAHVVKHKRRHCEECGMPYSHDNELAFHREKYEWIHLHGLPQCSGCRKHFKNLAVFDSHFKKCNASKQRFIAYEFSMPNS